MNVFKFIFLALAVVFGIRVSNAAVTTPVGYVTISIKAGSFTTPPTQLIGFGLAKLTAFQANIASVATVPGPSGQVTQLNFAPNSFAAGAFGASAGTATHYVEILDGVAEGRISPISSTLNDALVLSDLIPSFTGTVRARVRPLWTVQEVFGAENSAGFMGGIAPSVADVIRILRSDATVVEIFFNTTSNRWETAAGASANGLPIPVDAGLEVVRRGTSDFSFRILGEVKTGPTSVAVTGGSGTNALTCRQNLYPVPTMRLKDLGLYTGDPNTGVKAGNSATDADVVTIQDPVSGKMNQYFLDAVSGRWKTGFTDASLVQIPDNASVSLTRRNGSPFLWKLPQPVMALAEDPLPLTLVAATSRKTHGSSGSWEVNLPLTGSTSGVESRSGGSSNTCTVVFTFDGASLKNPLTGGNAVVSAGAGSVSGSPLFNGNEMVVNLTGVVNQQTTTVAVSNVTAQNGQAFASGEARVGVLIGDINYSKIVNSSDISINKSVSLIPISFGNFRNDVNASGAINSTDISLTQSKSLQTIP